MYDLLRVFYTGFLISMLGSLPLGTLNITAMQVSIHENISSAVKFSLGVALVEILYVRVSLTGMNWVMAHERLFLILEWATVLLFLALAAASFITAGKSRNQKNIILNNNMNRFVLGFTMSAVNPVQIPFWFIWSTYLMSNGILAATGMQFNTYTAGIGVGTLTALAIFVFAGRWVVAKMNASQRLINIFVGCVFVISAAFQLYRVVAKPMKEQLQEKTYLDRKQSEP